MQERETVVVGRNGEVSEDRNRCRSRRLGSLMGVVSVLTVSAEI